ncbi:hypothetical protein FHR81_003146 [Actinoalloteichus hoggarensis]|uniref:Uncharacterized protein n=1 Tax=Actinoalloteichus hoggarensis TaxID=1470176 RepID=A0A221W6L5_9PSEU|nr:hypothetical protein [Actinoalloteichus hoggarensis]ASO21505.1 hypothetical protein AHOG_19415 [Actinoalloteichus hoggarensis]MBB5922094.1 hypothetical protein [Actinoalloteichus hoggarensis]
MRGYEVVPDALRDSVRYLRKAADKWDAARSFLTDQDLSESDLGLLGEMTNATQWYNDALQEALERIGNGSAALEDSAVAMTAVAEDYANRDAEFYAQFNYLSDQLP